MASTVDRPVVAPKGPDQSAEGGRTGSTPLEVEPVRLSPVGGRAGLTSLEVRPGRAGLTSLEVRPA